MTNSARTQELIQAVEKADSARNLVESVQALAAQQSEEAISTLIAVLGYNNPGAALAAVEGLVKLGAPAVQPLLEQLDEYNYGARAYSIRALAAIADPRALDLLVTAAASDFAPSVRRAAAKGLGNLHWHKLKPEQVQDAQTQALNTLTQVSQDADWANRYAAVVGLHRLATQAAQTLEPIQTRLEQMLSSETEKAVLARVLLAKQQLQSVRVLA